MKNETRDRRRDLLWALPASLILHALIIALLVCGLPRPAHLPQQVQAVNVALVPPPEQPKPTPAPAPSPKEAKVEKLPEPKVEKPPEKNVEKPAPPEKQPRKPEPIEVLKPVFQFGDKDTGPRKSLDGGSAQENSPAPAKEDNSKPPDAAKDAENKSDASPAPDERADAAKDAEHAQDLKKPGAGAPAPLAAAGGDGEIELPASAQVPQSRPTNVPRPSPPKFSKAGSGKTTTPNANDVAAARLQGFSGLPGVRKLYSQGATGDALATSSMAGVPRDKRAAKLCASALQQQLLEASYFPDLIPLVPLKTGNVLDVPEAAFHTRSTWYGLSFRCEVDTDATRVLSFTFRVKTAIPPDEWARLGLPIRY